MGLTCSSNNIQQDISIYPYNTLFGLDNNNVDIGSGERIEYLKKVSLDYIIKYCDKCNYYNDNYNDPKYIKKTNGLNWNGILDKIKVIQSDRKIQKIINYHYADDSKNSGYIFDNDNTTQKFLNISIFLMRSYLIDEKQYYDFLSIHRVSRIKNATYHSKLEIQQILTDLQINEFLQMKNIPWTDFAKSYKSEYVRITDSIQSSESQD
jgi:hypothetical protein